MQIPPECRGPPQRIMDLYGYFDESGTHKGSRAFSLAGFLGKADEWGAFQVEWEAALQEFGLSFFHMAEFESRQEGYDWPEGVRRERINRLLTIIRRHVVGSFGIVFPLDKYDEIFRQDEIPPGPNVEWLAPGIAAPGAPRPGDAPPHEPDMKPGAIRRKSGGAYGLATTMLMSIVGEQVVKLPGDPFVAYTMETGAVGIGQTLKLFQDNYADDNQRRKLRLLSLSFEDKKRVLPLQAADLLAYELHKHLPRQLGQEERPTRYTLRELATTVPRFWSTVDEAELRKWHFVLGRGLHYSTGTWHK